MNTVTPIFYSKIVISNRDRVSCDDLMSSGRICGDVQVRVARADFRFLVPFRVCLYLPSEVSDDDKIK